MLRPNLALLMGSHENCKLELTVGSIRITDSSLYYHRQKKTQIRITRSGVTWVKDIQHSTGSLQEFTYVSMVEGKFTSHKGVRSHILC